MSDTQIEMTRHNVWDKLPSETPKAYVAFTTYLALSIYGEGDNKRNIPNVAKKLGLASPSGVEVWSSKYDWQARAMAYDAAMTTSALTMQESSLTAFRQDVITKAGAQITAMNQIIDAELRRMMDVQSKYTRPSYSVDPETGEAVEAEIEYVSPTEIKRLTEAIRIKDDIARRTAGMPTQFTTEKAEEADPEEAVYIIGGQ